MGLYDASGYWYAEGTHVPQAVELLNLLRTYREAERRMRAQIRGSMSMNETDLQALRFLLRAHRKKEILRQRDFAQELGISNASVSALIDRLCRDGYAKRIVHPEDRRSVGIIPTDHADTEVRQTLQKTHHRMLETAQSLSPAERVAAAKFLNLMTRGIEQHAEDGKSEAAEGGTRGEGL